ncbi:MAG: hypothetical protein JW958_01850 [Candidatus Eisenbacteria bacterium]|nr:hypothetical protein [Candidatus Eisenbacteria bacterium]
MRILLTGEIGSGKSTVVREVLRLAAFERVTGLFSRRVDERDGSRGYRLVSSLDGREMRFAFPKSGPDDGPGKFRIDREVFDRFGAEVLRAAARDADSPLVIDELGIFERGASAYVEAVGECVARKRDALVVVQERARDFWTPILRTEEFDRCAEVTLRNRDGLPITLAELFSRPGGGERPGNR